MMKSQILILLFVLSLGLSGQPVSGYLGKKLMSSIELEILPGFQDYEANTSEFLAFFTDSRSYVPRIYVNTDYQFKSNTVASGALGYSRLQVPFREYSDGPVEFIRPMNSVALQLRLKKGTLGMIMPTSSSYIAYGVGLYFLGMPSVPLISDANSISPVLTEVTSVSAFNFAVNLEYGRRVVFNPGIVLDFGIVANLSTGLFALLKDEDFVDEINEDYIKSQMVQRSAKNSLLNFKIGIGFFY